LAISREVTLDDAFDVGSRNTGNRLHGHGAHQMQPNMSSPALSAIKTSALGLCSALG
jgi:hypothetical protein